MDPEIHFCQGQGNVILGLFFLSSCGMLFQICQAHVIYHLNFAWYLQRNDVSSGKKDTHLQHYFLCPCSANIFHLFCLSLVLSRIWIKCIEQELILSWILAEVSPPLGHIIGILQFSSPDHRRFLQLLEAYTYLFELPDHLLE